MFRVYDRLYEHEGDKRDVSEIRHVDLSHIKGTTRNKHLIKQTQLIDSEKSYDFPRTIREIEEGENKYRLPQARKSHPLFNSLLASSSRPRYERSYIYLLPSLFKERPSIRFLARLAR